MSLDDEREAQDRVERPLLRLDSTLEWTVGGIQRELKHAKLPGFPTQRYASDHLCLMAKFILSPPELLEPFPS